ncbi:MULTISPECIES: hypothetical protein [Rothia]|nr:MULTISPECIES: hypothetical protein [Rothia]QXW92319.1 hypothetical protein LPB401_09835 [Rothia aeria]
MAATDVGATYFGPIAWISKMRMEKKYAQRQATHRGYRAPDTAADSD